MELNLAVLYSAFSFRMHFSNFKPSRCCKREPIWGLPTNGTNKIFSPVAFWRHAHTHDRNSYHRNCIKLDQSSIYNNISLQEKRKQSAAELALCCWLFSTTKHKVLLNFASTFWRQVVTVSVEERLVIIFFVRKTIFLFIFWRSLNAWTARVIWYIWIETFCLKLAQQ